MRAFILIPARLASTRLPNKLLLDRTGKPLIQHTFESASRATLTDGIGVATDHESIQRVVEEFGGRAWMTDPDLPSGTDRIAAVAEELADVDIIVNVQGDEPEISADAIDTVIRSLAENDAVNMSTLATPIRDRKILDDPSCVKVVRNRQGRAMYFSRSVIPHPREWDDELLIADPPLFLLHLGIYAYRRDFLLQLASLPTSKLETTEKLEQLRVLELGHSIQVGVVNDSAVGIDTADDYEAFVSRIRS
jgi:3-deoxy-manno-octulosonate cytidylyltransferase (CMP-KDO synthetase)